MANFSPNVPMATGVSEGIIIGRGGGYVRRFCDFTLLPSGVVTYLTFILDVNGSVQGEPVSTELLQKEESATFDSFKKRLIDMDFHRINLPAPTSNYTEYLFLIDPEKGTHGVSWAAAKRAEIPVQLETVVRDFRHQLTLRFSEEYA